VLEQLLTRWPGLCVIIITGYPSLEDMRATFKLKVFDYLAKPFTLAQLRQVLKNATEAFGWAGRRRTAAGAAGAQHQNAARGARLVPKGSRSTDEVKCVANQRIERGTNMPSMESLLAISKAFERKPSEILAGSIFEHAPGADPNASFGRRVAIVDGLSLRLLAHTARFTPLRWLRSRPGAGSKN